MPRVVRVLLVVAVVFVLVIVAGVVYMGSRKHVFLNGLRNQGIVVHGRAFDDLLQSLEAKYPGQSIPFVVFSLSAQAPDKEELEIWRPDAGNPLSVVDGCKVGLPGPMNVYQHITFYIDPARIPGEMANFNLDLSYCVAMQFLADKQDIAQNDELGMFVKDKQSRSVPIITYSKK